MCEWQMADVIRCRHADVELVVGGWVTRGRLAVGLLVALVIRTSCLLTSMGGSDEISPTHRPSEATLVNGNVLTCNVFVPAPHVIKSTRHALRSGSS